MQSNPNPKPVVCDAELPFARVLAEQGYAAWVRAVTAAGGKG
jgi:hypothetical protein